MSKTEPTKKTKPGVSTDLREGKDRSHQENKTWSEHRSSGRVRQTPTKKTKPGVNTVPREG